MSRLKKLRTNNTYTPKSGLYANKAAHNTSLSYGAYFNFDINKHFQFEGGVGAIEYGAKYVRISESSLGSRDTTTYDDNLIQKAFYISVPLLVKYKISPKSSIIGGVRNSWELNSEFTEISGTKAGNVYHDETFSTIKGVPERAFLYDNNLYDFGLILGYEYHFNTKFSASLLLNIGTVPLLSKEFVEGWKNYGTWANFYIVNLAGNYNSSISINVAYNLMGGN